MGADDRGRHEDQGERFVREVRRKALRRQQARRGRSILSWIGVFGMVGWTVSIPALVGAAIGQWIDRTHEDRISWTLSLLLLGLMLGSGIAWYWVTRESRRDD